MRKYSSIRNGRKGGRPQLQNIKFEIPNIEIVILTPKQYRTLLEKYGYDILQKALQVLENWLKTSPEGDKYRGRNNYGHFRSDGWLINSVIRS